MFENMIDHATLGVFGLLSGGLKKETAEEQYQKNKEAWEKREAKARHRYIERQPELTDLHYGTASRLEQKLFFGGRKLSAAENACEVIAVYNALLALRRGGEQKGRLWSFPALLRYFSAKGICANGVFGTSPKALEHFFEQHGYRTETLRGSRITEEALLGMQQSCGAFILTAFNEGQNPFHMVHTMCISREKDGYHRHNDYEVPKAYESLYAAVQDYHGGRGHALCVVGVAG
ncbi:MAG: hypothetical protein IJ600_10715 [Lachnospiraceae bacterium]|nr:hypothetical protein [Lachnospiraceae bacterium]